MNPTIDIHCHILPGIDDGAADIQESLEMARMAVADGVKHIIATPHFTSADFNHRTVVHNKVNELQKALDKEGIPLQIYPGNEVRFESQAYFYEHANKQHFCYLDHGEKFLLFEQRWMEYDKDCLETVQWLVERGTIPIIPHPERHFYFRSDPPLLLKLIESGAWTQVSVDSLIGRNKEEAQLFAEWLVTNGYAFVLATDAHNHTKRWPNLSLGFQWLKEHAEQEQTTKIQLHMEQIVQAVVQ